MTKYQPGKIEKKWQKRWEKEGIFKEYSKKEKFYALDMFPYPSGSGLHVGHPKGYVATDVVARFEQLRGKSVLHPMGWDAFGLPAENYALKNKIHPQKAVKENVARFKEQLQQIGFTYDWDREINTTDPQYYKWTQWIFLKMFEKGLAYESEEPVNWCANCKTVLANEDLEQGKCERCGGEIIQRPLKQWVLKMTKYADRLLEDLEKESLNWESSIIEQQKNWIGRSEGVVVKFPLVIARNEESSTSDEAIHLNRKRDFVEVFTTRVDTIFGCTYVVLAPEHTWIRENREQITNWKEAEMYVEQAKKKTAMERGELNKEKTGVKLEGIEAINPFTKKTVPVFVADYVLGSYGTGAVMAVPAHDERDWEFAKKYELPIRHSIAQETGEKRENAGERKCTYGIIENDKGEVLLQFLKQYKRWTLPGGGIEEGESNEEGLLREIREETGYVDCEVDKNIGSVEASYFGRHFKQAKLAKVSVFTVRLFSRTQEEVMWDEDEKEIGMEHSWVSPRKALQYFSQDSVSEVVLYNLFERYLSEKYCFTGIGMLIDSGEFTGLTSEEARNKMADWLEQTGNGKRTVKYKMRDWVFSRQRYWGEPIPLVHCETCGVVGIPEKQLPVELPEVVSYEPTDTGESPLATIKEWVHTTCPKCNKPAKRETNTMPQWAGSSWYYLAYILGESIQEPVGEKGLAQYKKDFDTWLPVDLYVGGAEHATRHLLYARFWHKFLYDIDVVGTKEPFKKLMHVGLINAADGRKMSKRWGNVINPDDVVREFGADSLRLYEMFMGPFTQNISWNTESVSGVWRFLDKSYRLFDRVHAEDASFKQGKDIEILLHKTIKKVTEDIESFRFNTAISSMMILMNALEKEKNISLESYKSFLVLLAPFAPHMTEEVWEKLGNVKSIFLELWPVWDVKKIVDEMTTLVIQVNGKVRETREVSANISEEEAKKLALESEKIQKFLEGKDVKKIIFVKGRLINIVV